jgi:hypothetical protein
MLEVRTSITNEGLHEDEEDRGRGLLNPERRTMSNPEAGAMSIETLEAAAWDVQYSYESRGKYGANRSAIVIATTIERAIAIARTIDGLRDIHAVNKRSQYCPVYVDRIDSDLPEV